jgi:hypothetical protein
VGDLLEWAGRRDDAARSGGGGGGNAAAVPAGAAGAGSGGGWLQAVAALPLGPEEERVAAAWLEARGAAGGADGDLLPLYLLQVRPCPRGVRGAGGLSLERLGAWAAGADACVPPLRLPRAYGQRQEGGRGDTPGAAPQSLSDCLVGMQGP